MKRTRIWNILALLAIFGLLMVGLTACNNGNNDSGGSGGGGEGDDNKVVMFYVHKVNHETFQLIALGAKITHNNIGNLLIMSPTDPLKGPLVAGGVVHTAKSLA